MERQTSMRNRPISDREISVRSSISSWWGSFLTAAILTVAVRNLMINTRTLAITKENMENTKLNAVNTAEMIEQLKQINQKL